MNGSDLTVVIPTRDRPVLLQSCLRSIFERQSTIPNVIVSDNSTADDPRIHDLRVKYPFAYVRQSGRVSQCDHHNMCLSLASTRWMMCVHDDDELFPGSLSEVATLLARCEGAAVVVAGLQYIDATDAVYRNWTPSPQTLKGDEGLLQIGCDFHARSPNTIFDVVRGRQIGGFPEVEGLAGDYTFFSELAYRYGVSFVAEPLGRYRTGHEQITNYDTPERAVAHLRYCARMAGRIRSTGCSAMVADRLLDQMAWGLFLFHAARWPSEPPAVLNLFDEALRLSPQPGPLHQSAQIEYPILFWRPQWLARLLFSRISRAEYVVKRRRAA